MNEVGRHGKGESVWMGWFLSYILKRFIPIVASRGDGDRVTHYQSKIDSLKESIESNAWDGGWYRRAFFDDGSPVGSASSVECKIDSLSQTWSIISGVGDPSRAKLAMGEVYKQLVDEEHKLIRLLFPPFDSGPQEPGYIKGYLPGVRENGGQYTHAAAWVIIATAMVGDGERAEKLFRLINPLHHTTTEQEIKKYRGEPYVLCGDVYSVAPHEGRAGWSWYTGSSGWMYQAGVEHILGLKARAEYFFIDPCIPPHWKDFQLKLTRGGTTYLISVKNGAGVSRGVATCTVNGRHVPDGKIPWSTSNEGEKVIVDVVMG